MSISDLNAPRDPSWFARRLERLIRREYPGLKVSVEIFSGGGPRRQIVKFAGPAHVLASHGLLTPNGALSLGRRDGASRKGEYTEWGDYVVAGGEESDAWVAVGTCIDYDEYLDRKRDRHALTKATHSQVASLLKPWLDRKSLRRAP